MSTPYHRLSVAEKERLHRDRMREPPTRCHACDAAVQPDDLLAHQRERCPGRPAPHPRSRWITWAEVRRMGVPSGTLRRWVVRGLVRVRQEGLQGQRRGRGRPSVLRYQLRDVVQIVAQRRFISTRGDKYRRR